MRQNTEPVIDFQVRANKPPDHAGGKCDDGHARTGNSYWAAVYSFQWDLASADTNLTLNIRYPKNSTRSHNEIIKSLFGGPKLYLDLPPLIVPITELVQRVQPVQAAPQAQLEPGDDILVHCAV